MPITVNLTVLDSTTQKPVAGGSVCVNGIVVGQVSGGAAAVSFPAAGSYELTLKADLYESYSDPNFSVSTSGATDPILLDPTAGSAPPVVVNVTVEPLEAGVGATVTFTSTTNQQVYTTQANSDAEGIVTVPPDTYTVEVDQEGYTSDPQTIDTSNEDSVTIWLQADDDSQADQPNSPKQSPATEILAAVEDVNSRLDDPEWIYPNSASGKYFTTTQARMYIGNLFIDELNSVQFCLQYNQIPVFGYRSKYFDALAQGRSLVQGQLGINFVTEGYLYTVLSEYKNLDPGEPIDDSIEELIQVDQKYQTLAAKLPTVTDGDQHHALELTLRDLGKRRADLLSALPPSAVSQLKTRRQASGDNMNIRGGYLNATYLTVPFDIVVQLTGGGRTVTRKLEKCVLTGNEQCYDQSGCVLLDTYSFIARRLR